MCSPNRTPLRPIESDCRRRVRVPSFELRPRRPQCSLCPISPRPHLPPRPPIHQPPRPPKPQAPPDTPASLDHDTPFSDAAPVDASDADTPALASTPSSDAPGDGEDDGINHPSGGSRKHMTLAPPPTKKSKKKGGNSVWSRPASRKGKKKARQPGSHGHGPGGGATGAHTGPNAGGDELCHLVPATRLAAEPATTTTTTRYEPKQRDPEYKGMPFHVQIPKEHKITDPVPGSLICYFKNGVCQGSAFKDIPGGRYYPAASMYTLPNEPNCVVKFNFEPDFEFYPQDFGDLPIPQPMSDVPYQAVEVKKDGPVENGIAEKTS